MKVCDKFSINQQLIDNETEKKLIDGDEYESIVSLCGIDFVFHRYPKSEVPNKKIYDTYNKNIITLEVKCHLDSLEKAQIIL